MPRTSKDKSDRSHAREKTTQFSEVIRRRRRELNLTQEQIASRIGTSKPYIAHLEAGDRHPSDKIVARLARVLGLDFRNLLLLATPRAQALLAAELERARGSTWEQFRQNRQLQRLYNVTNDELEVLSRVALLGEIHSARDLIYVLNAIRHALGR